MRYLFSLILTLIVSAVFVYPAGANPHKSNINKEVLKKIKKARLTGRYVDLTDKPVICDSPERSSDQITQIVIHSTHVSHSHIGNGRQ